MEAANNTDGTFLSSNPLICFSYSALPDPFHPENHEQILAAAEQVTHRFGPVVHPVERA
ncbi:MAG: hypothetical protein HQ583_10875 [Candidatus Abyssubacteria bacterium]|nr:hypothetical protein [Candidatus Abyssubacteria bacterium]